MSITSLFFNKGNYIEEIELDIIISESASATARVTKNPVEKGADINDHKIIEPMTFTMSGVVSNTPSSLFNQFNRTTGSDRTKAQSAWDDLLKLHKESTPFTLVQGLKSYDNVTMISLTESQDVDTANELSFTATFTELNLAGVDAPPIVTYADQDTSDKASPSTNSGLKQI